VGVLITSARTSTIDEVEPRLDCLDTAGREFEDSAEIVSAAEPGGPIKVAVLAKSAEVRKLV
jgi:hypothetical protein